MLLEIEVVSYKDKYLVHSPDSPNHIIMHVLRLIDFRFFFIIDSTVLKKNSSSNSAQFCSVAQFLKLLADYAERFRNNSKKLCMV